MDSLNLMQLGTDATIGHSGDFGMIQWCLEFLIPKRGHRRTFYAFARFIVVNPASTCEGPFRERMLLQCSVFGMNTS